MEAEAVVFGVVVVLTAIAWFLSPRSGGREAEERATTGKDDPMEREIELIKKAQRRR